MTDFIERPASRKSLAMRKPICGVGINDSWYVTSDVGTNGNVIRCPIYKTWIAMIKRCYLEACHKNQPTYADCTVCDEWLVFSNFYKWMIKQDYMGLQLDKDVLISGNKVYGPEACVFISQEINKLLNQNRKKKGSLPQGVRLDTSTGKFRAICSINGKKKDFGSYRTISDAKSAYRAAKYSHMISIAEKQSNELIRKAIYMHASKYHAGFKAPEGE